MIDKELLKELRAAPELQDVEIIDVEKDRISLIFQEGSQRTGEELTTVQSLLFKYKIFNFIKSEKVLFFENEIKQINISIY